MTRLLAFLILAIGFAAPAAAQEFPELTGRVVDQANVIDPIDESGLTQKLETLEQSSGRQLVVVTVGDLQGYSIEDYGYRLGREWGIGQAEENANYEKNNGVLLIVAPNDRRVRIEVGYGLEPVLTDGLSYDIVENTIIPEFKEGRMSQGIVAGADAIAAQLALPQEEAARIAAAADAEASESGDRQGNIPTGMIMFWIGLLVFFVLPAIARRNRRGRKYRSGPWGRKGRRRQRRDDDDDDDDDGGLGAWAPVILWGSGSGWGGGGSSFGGGGFGGGSFGGFSGGGGSFGGGGASGGW